MECVITVSASKKGNNMRKLIMIVLTTLFISVLQVNAQSTAQVTAQSTSDAELIKQTALNYIEGWYEGNAERMERALHPELAKRIVRTDARGRNSLGQMSAMTLVQLTRAEGGKNTPKEKQQKDVTVLDIFGNAASAKVIASDWIDYLHLAKWNGRWVIVNVLWEVKPTK
jgi:Putative lumazine-binding